MVQRLAREHPDKTVVSLDPLICPCSTMFRIDGPHLAWVLESLVAGEVVNQIVVDARHGRVGPRRARSACSTSPDRDSASCGRRSSNKRGIVAASRYSWALARKPSGGAGSSMRSISRPCARHRVDVLRQRPVHERQHHARRELLHRDVGREVRADAPVLLVEDVVDHPAAVRRLQQRVVQQEDEPPARLRAPARPRRSRRRDPGCARTRGTRRRRRSSRRGTAASRRSART